MSRYIDADLLLAQCRRNPLFEKTEKDKGMMYIERSIIDDIPTADVAEVRHGKWKYVDGDLGYSDLECSECEATTLFFDDERFNYCPNCGAKMDGERREG